MKSRNERRSSHGTGRAGTQTRSSRPSSGRARGAITAPAPYSRPFATVIRNADRVKVSPAARTVYVSPRQESNSRTPAGKYAAGPRRGSALNTCARWASKPIPATLTNRRPSTSPVSIRRTGPVSAVRRAAPTRRSSPRPRAKPLPEPAGTTPSAASVSAAAAATSLTVPSPPHATTVDAPAAINAWAISRALPRCSVTRTSPSTAHARKAALARATAPPIPRRFSGPAAGLMMMPALMAT